MAESVAVGNTPFLWKGTDRKGNKVKGKSMARNESAVRADLRRQGVVLVPGGPTGSRVRFVQLLVSPANDARS